MIWNYQDSPASSVGKGVPSMGERIFEVGGVFNSNSHSVQSLCRALSSRTQIHVTHGNSISPVNLIYNLAPPTVVLDARHVESLKRHDYPARHSRVMMIVCGSVRVEDARNGERECNGDSPYMSHRTRSFKVNKPSRHESNPGPEVLIGTCRVCGLHQHHEVPSITR